MANLKYTLGGYNLIPDTGGADRSRTPIREELGMAAGNVRYYARPAARRIRWSLTRSGASEADRTAWAAAATAAEAGATLVEPDGSSWTVVLISYADPIADKTVASGDGTTSATGTLEYTLSIEVQTL